MTTEGTAPPQLGVQSFKEARFALWDVWLYCRFVRRDLLHIFCEAQRKNKEKRKNPALTPTEKERAEKEWNHLLKLSMTRWDCPFAPRPEYQSRCGELFGRKENNDSELTRKLGEAYDRSSLVDKNAKFELDLDALENALGIPELFRRQRELDDEIANIFWHHATTLEKITPYIQADFKHPITRRDAEKLDMSVLKDRIGHLDQGIQRAAIRWTKSSGCLGRSETEDRCLTEEEMRLELGVPKGGKLGKEAALNGLRKLIAAGRHLEEYAKWSLTAWARVFGVSSTTVSREWKRVRAAVSQLRESQAGRGPSIRKGEFNKRTGEMEAVE